MAPTKPAEKSQRLVVTALPHVFLPEGLDMEITACTVDGKGQVQVKAHERLVSLSAWGTWDQATVEGTISVPQETIETVFPEEEHASPPGRLLLVSRCRDTILRDKHFVSDVPLTPGEHSFEVTLQNAMLRGTLEVLPVLVRATKAKKKGGAYGRFPSIRLASDEPWYVEIDEPDAEGILRPRLEKFSERDWLPGKEHLYHLSLKTPETPVLYLNADHGGIMGVLDSDGTTGSRARIRDATFDTIESAVWTELLVQTASDIDEEGQVKYAWQEDVIDIFYRDLYEELDQRETVIEKLREDVSDAEYTPLLLQAINQAVQKRIKLPEQLQNLIEEVIS